MARRLCAIFAHPDDESFSSGATLAQYADEGVEVTLVTSTRGEAGETGSAPVAKADLGPWRERELRAAAGVLGVQEVRILGLPDGRLVDHHDELLRGITEAIRAVRPQVVLTEDVRGITGHPDHIAVTRAVVEAVTGLGDEGPLKLYEHVLPPDEDSDSSISSVPVDFITTTVDATLWRERQLAALAMHASQVDEETLNRFRSSPDSWLQHFVCVRTRVPILIPEYDLFAGIDQR